MLHRTELSTTFTLQRGNDWCAVEDYGQFMILCDKHGSWRHHVHTAKQIIKAMIASGFQRRR